MDHLAHIVILASGWRRALIAFVSGACGALMLAPLDIAPALIVTMTMAVWLIDGTAAYGGPRDRRSLKSAAVAGWWLGFGYFIAGLWWLGSAFLIEADEFAWALPLGVIGLPAVLALFTALGFVLARLLWSGSAWRVLALAAGLGTAEWLRGIVLTGFPWNSFGMALATEPALAQTASVLGLYGLTLIAIAIAASPATLGTGGSARERWSASLCGLAILGIMAAGGALRLAHAETGMVPGVRFRVIQPNVPQDAKFTADAGEAILRRYLTLSSGTGDLKKPALNGVTHIVWPESAFPFILGDQPAALAQIAALLKPEATLLTGAVRRGDRLPGETRSRYYNSLQVVGADGSILASADKVHLVPFGEYLPLNSVLSRLGLRRFVHAPGAFTEGEQLRVLPVPGLDGVAPLICYEAIFSGAVVPEGTRPRLFLNVTNDAWFGITPGPYQHFAQARLRSIEEGLPMVRGANSGISAIIDPYGRILAKIDLGSTGQFDADLPKASAPTIFNKTGSWPAALLALMMAALALTIPYMRA
jgi:apolipoprotein N-acyltransferase